MDFKSPIDITAVIGAVTKHKDLLTAIDEGDAHDILKHFTAIPGVTDSIVLGRVTLASVGRKYTGEFKGHVESGEFQPRTLKVYPCVMEMADEPERYRRTYITEVKGGLWPKQHPFEVWIINYGLKSASNDLHNVCLTAEYSEAEGKDTLADSFDGPLTILQKEITAGTISKDKGNMFATGAMTRADVGEKLLEMWRDMPQKFRNRGGVMYISEDLGNMYDDWLDDQGTLVTGSGAETAGEQYLRNTNKKCKLVRLSGYPEKSQFVILTFDGNIYYGYDKDSDFKSLKPFNSGNPYKFTAAGKFVLGFQFATIHKNLFRVNDQSIVPASE